MSQWINVAVMADKNVEIGLHVMLYSLLMYSKTAVKIYFFNKDYAESDITNLHRTLSSFDGFYQLHLQALDDRMFEGLRKLRTSLTIYQRLIIPDLIPEDRVIILDADLILKLDITNLYHEDLKGHVLGASGVGNIKFALDGYFLTSLDLDEYAPYFNNGVLLVDIQKWRSKNITSKCFHFARKHCEQLRSHDQTVLNYVFYKNFLSLDKKYNVCLSATTKSINTSDSEAIFHFLGAPKPWDFLGEFFHSNYAFFQTVLEKTYFRDFRSYKQLSLGSFYKTIRSVRSYYKCLKWRVQGFPSSKADSGEKS